MDAAQHVSANLASGRLGDGDVVADQQDGAVRIRLSGARRLSRACRCRCRAGRECGGTGAHAFDELSTIGSHRGLLARLG